MKVTVVCEFNLAMASKQGLGAYPEGMGECLRNLFIEGGHQAVYVKSDENGVRDLTDELLQSTEVLVWWGHFHHEAVEDGLVEKIANRVQRGMGLICLHSAHVSKIFKRMVGSSGSLKWREVGEQERLWCIDPTHPINNGLGEYVDIMHEEMYGEPFDIPTPDELVYIGWFKGGEVFRGGCVFNRGRGKVFYFNPGHETYPTYKNSNVRKILLNAVEYVKNPRGILDKIECPNIPEFSVK